LTVTEEGKDKPTGIPGVKPARLEDLPEEEREIYQKQLELDEKQATQEIAYRDFTQDKAQVFDQTEPENALDWFQKKTTEGFKYWAQFTQYKIKMDDGRVEHYQRQPITKYQSDELLDVSSEIQGMKELDTEKALTVTQVRQKQKLLDQLKAKYYLFNLKTKKPMSMEEVKHVADSTIIDSILEA
jgi:hypothetical protein